MAYGNILNVSPVPSGWFAVYAGDKSMKGRYSFYKKPICCWATVEITSNKTEGQKNATIVVGLVIAETGSAVLDFADFVDNFLGYDFPACDVDWGKLADLHRREDKTNNKKPDFG